MEVNIEIYYGRVGESQRVELVFSTADMLVRVPNLTFESCEAFIDDIRDKLHNAKWLVDNYEHTRHGGGSDDFVVSGEE